MTTAAQQSAAETAYLDNADYAETLNVSKCRLFITACRKLLLILPSSVSKGANSMTNRIDLIRDELREAQLWLEAHSEDDVSGPKVTLTSFKSMRGNG